MNITFLIGNGFDVGVGMKSRFSDYFPIYIEQSKNKEVSLKGLADDIDINKTEWSYFEKKLGSYLKKFNSETKDIFIRQVQDFEKGFIEYLKGQENMLNYKNSDEISSVMTSALQSFYSTNNIAIASYLEINKLFNANAGVGNIYNFISFNYTSILENCLSCIKDGIVNARKVASGHELNDKIGKIVHVHGYSTLKPIMGVNDESQLDNEELSKDKKFTKYIVKPILNKVHRMNFDSEATKLINNSSIICIYGMSLGETDKCWWNKILVWLNNNSNRQLIIFDYDENYTESTQIDWIEKEDYIMEKLNQFIDDQQLDIEKLRYRIHIAVHKNIFKINLANDNRWVSEKIPALV